MHLSWRARPVHKAINKPCLLANVALCWLTILRHFSALDAASKICLHKAAKEIACWPNKYDSALKLLAANTLLHSRVP